MLGLHELEDGFRLLQVPNHNFAVFTGTREDVWDDAVPADRSDPASLMKVWLARLELCGLLQVLRDILDEDLGSTTGQKILLVRIELNGFDGRALMDLRC